MMQMEIDVLTPRSFHPMRDIYSSSSTKRARSPDESYQAERPTVSAVQLLITGFQMNKCHSVALETTVTRIQ